MYAAHFAIGLALQSRTPRQPAWPIVLGVGLLDLLNGLFIVLGWDQVSPNPAAGPYLYFDLLFIDWDHSLLAALLWSTAWALLCLGLQQGRHLAGWAGLAALSHWLADWPVHNHDLALYPHAATRLGAGLWGQLGTAAWWLEGGFALALCAWAWARARRAGQDWRWPALLVGALWLGLSPWASPMPLIGRWPEPWAHLGHGMLVGLGFALPGLALLWLLQRARNVESPQAPNAP